MITIRPATTADAAAVTELSTQLGYPVPESDIAARLGAFANSDLHCVLVAQLDSDVVGWIEPELCHHLASGRRGEIAGLVVKAGHRSKGIGNRLLEAAEKWIQSRGAATCVVRSRSTRTDAHRFYLREGYTLDKTSAVFSKKLT